MPAAARRSKSEAYEQGIREGMAMSRRARVMKPSEEEEMEMDMGMDPNHSRKRSAKGAKRTKPATDGMGKKKPMDGGMYGKKPMDGGMGMKKSMDGGMKKSMDMCGGMKKPMDGECDCRGKKGCKCDGSCGSMRKRGDSLTPQEYLAACDMGIQDRSTAYIRARLDTAEARNDLKCGKGAISEGENCTKGTAQKVQPKKPGKARTIASTGAILGGLALNAGATGYGFGKALSGDFAGAGRAFQVASAGTALTAAGARGLGLKKESNKLFANAALTAGAGTLLREQQTGEIGNALGRARNSTLAKQLRYAPGNAVGRARMAAMRRRPMPKPRMKNGKIANPWQDSMFADGFTPGNFDI